MPGLYEGQHAFVFLGREDDISSIIAALQEAGDIDPRVGPVYFISPCEGAFAGFAHIAQDDVPALADYVGGQLWEAGIRHGDYAVEGRVYLDGRPRVGPKGPTRKLYAIIALCRIFVSQPPAQVMERIAETFGHRDPPLAGVATVIGDFHLLVELGGEDRETLNRHVAALGEVPGVERVEAGFAVPGTSLG
jgi:hypothetical protein